MIRSASSAPARRLAVHLGARDAVAGQAALPDAEYVTFAAQFSDLLRRSEAVGGFTDHVQRRAFDISPSGSL